MVTEEVIMRITNNAFVFLSALFVAVACGGNDLPDDGTNNAECGHGGCDDAQIWQLGEGGEIHVEYISSPFGETTRANAHFLMASRNFDLFADGCHAIQPANLSSSDQGRFPLAQDETRQYADVGQSVSIGFAGKASLELSKSPDPVDFNGRAHDTWYAYLNEAAPAADLIGFNQSAIASLEDGSQYEVIMPGRWAPTTFDPAQGLGLSRGQDNSLGWSVNNDELDDATNHLFLFIDMATGFPTHVCSGPNQGQLTIPVSTANTLPDSGMVLFGVTSHRVVEWNGQRLDLIGQNCFFTPFSAS